MLENNTAALYVCLSEKVDTSQAQSILKEIAIDSQKNNSLLKDLSEKILKPNVKSIDNETEFGDAFKLIYVLRQYIERNEKLDAANLHIVSSKLAMLEKLLDEKYFIAKNRVIKTIERDSGAFQSLSLDSFASFFDRISFDQAKHLKLLSGLDEFCRASKKAVTEIEVQVAFPSDLPHEALLLESYKKGI